MIGHAAALVTGLLESSDEFRSYWGSMQVAALSSTRKRLIHPKAGELDIQCDIVLSPGTGDRLVIFRPQPGSNTANRLAFLGVLGAQKCR